MRNSFLIILLVAMQAFAQDQYETDDDTVGLWRFNLGTGTIALDRSSNDNDGTLADEYGMWTSSGEYFGGILCDGVVDNVTVSSNSTLDISTSITLEAWIYPTVKKGGDVVRKDGAYGLNVSKLGNTLYHGGSVWVGEIEYGLTSSSGIVLDTWQHIAMTYDGSDIRLFVNSVEVDSTTQSGSIDFSSHDLKIGGRWAYFAGRLDDVRISDVIRSTDSMHPNYHYSQEGFDPKRGGCLCQDGSLRKRCEGGVMAKIIEGGQ